jgi:methionyl aminopeptidase
VTCISVNEEVVHGIPGPRQLAEGDVVSLDTGCRLLGWCGDAALTVPVGKVSADAQRLLETGAGVLELAVALTAKKERWSQVAAEMQRFVAQQGCGMVDALVGHGIGRRMHEPPEVPNVDTPEWREKDFLLEPGLVLAIEPMVALGSGDVMCLEDGWTVVTQDGRWAAHFERTVAIGRDGPVVLTPWK